MNRSELPAGFHIPPHSHSHGELLVVLKGSCTVDDEQGRAIELSAKDSIVIDPNYRYGITCGADGMEFLTIRAGEASSDFAG